MLFLTKIQLMTLLESLIFHAYQSTNFGDGSDIIWLSPQGQHWQQEGQEPRAYYPRYEIEGPPVQNTPDSASAGDKWWCPSTDSIYPCTCDGPQGFIVITCDRISGASDLSRIFSTDFPVQELGKVIITNSGVETLDPRTLGSVGFEYLHMKKNILKSIDENALSSASTNLKRLEIIHNNLENFPFHTVSLYPKVEYLDLHYNAIKMVPDYAFGPNSRLKELDLSFNKINYVGTDAFKDLYALEKLNLKFNKLTVLNNNAFALTRPNPRLQLDLSSNQISFVASGAFDRQIPLELNLTSNSLRTFPESIFLPILQGMKTTQTGIIYVNDNRFRCSCENIHWLIKLDYTYRRHVQDLFCKDLGRSFDTMNSDDLGCIR